MITLPPDDCTAPARTSRPEVTVMLPAAVETSPATILSLAVNRAILPAVAATLPRNMRSSAVRMTCAPRVSPVTLITDGVSPELATVPPVDTRLAKVAMPVLDASKLMPSEPLTLPAVRLPPSASSRTAPLVAVTSATFNLPDESRLISPPSADTSSASINVAATSIPPLDAVRSLTRAAPPTSISMPLPVMLLVARRSPSESISTRPVLENSPLMITLTVASALSANSRMPVAVGSACVALTVALTRSTASVTPAAVIMWKSTLLPVTDPLIV